MLCQSLQHGCPRSHLLAVGIWPGMAGGECGEVPCLVVPARSNGSAGEFAGDDADVAAGFVEGRPLAASMAALVTS